VPQWVAHRDSRWFPESERFLPERWLPGAQPDLPKFAYFPFGGGPRVCIGEPFAELEAPIIISTLARRWKMRVADGFEPEAEALTTLRFKNGLPMVLTDRTKDA
jgi:cytochrome P450